MIIKLLILQVRDDKEGLVQEQASFRRILKNSNIDITFFSFFEKRKLNYTYFDGIIIGGSPYSITQKYHWISKLLIDIIEINNRKIPLLGICFGFQAIAKALGGTTVKDKKLSEFGSFRVLLEDRNWEDNFLSRMPKMFYVQQGHEDYVATLPKKAIILARNSNNLVEAARFSSTSVGVQFHPEMSIEDMMRRYRLVFKANNTMSKEFRKKLHPSPASIIVTNFVTSIREK